MSFSSTEVIIEELKAGRVVVLTDDEDRENEGDLVALADRVTPDQINFMLREARGLLCLSLSADICDQLDLSVQTKGAAARHGATAFTETLRRDPGRADAKRNLELARRALEQPRRDPQSGADAEPEASPEPEDQASRGGSDERPTDAGDASGAPRDGSRRTSSPVT